MMTHQFSIFRIFSCLSCCVFVISVLSACESSAVKEKVQLPTQTFDHFSTQRILAHKIEILDNYSPQNGDVANQLPMSPSNALKAYIEKRFNPVAPNGQLLITIQDASVMKSIIESDNMWDVFDLTRKEEYTANVDLLITLTRYTSTSSERRSAKVFAQRILTLPESYSIAKKEDLQFKMIENLIDELDPVIQESFKNTFHILIEKRPDTSQASQKPTGLLPLPEMR